MSFREVGQDFGNAIDFYQQEKEKAKKEAAVRDFVTRQLSRLPPDKQAEAQALLTTPTAQALPASSVMDGTPDAPIPPEVSGLQSGATTPAPINDLFMPPAPGLAHLAGPKPDPGAESLRMLLEATRDQAMQPKGLFDYIANMGKQDMVGSNQMNLEAAKESLRRDLQNADLQARLDRLERVLTTRKDIAGDQIDSREKIAGDNNDTRRAIADKGNATRKEIADKRPAGKAGKDPDTMTPEELDAELAIYGARADSLNTAGGDPKAVGYKPAEEKFATIDEANRQKDLSKTEDRITQLRAAKARKDAAGGAPAAPGAAPAAAGKVYASKDEVRADIAKGLIGKGQRIMMMVNGQQVQTVPVK